MCVSLENAWVSVCLVGEYTVNHLSVRLLRYRLHWSTVCSIVYIITGCVSLTTTLLSVCSVVAYMVKRVFRWKMHG